MGGVEDNQWVDKFMDGIGLAFTKIDETIQKGIELWTELTRVDDQPTQGLTGQPKSGVSGDESSSQYPVAEVKERVPIQVYWSMCRAEVEKQPSQHCVTRASTISESLIQEQSGNGDEEEEEESTVSEEDNESSSTWNHDYHYQELLKMIVDKTSAEEADNDGDDEDLDTFSGEDDEDLDTFSEEDDENDDDEEDGTTTSKSTENMSELSTDSSLKWKGSDYQLLKNVDTSSEEEDDESSDDDQVWECYSEDVGEVTEISWMHIMMSNLSNNESLRVKEDEDDVTDKLLLQGFVDVRQEEEIGNKTELSEVETLLPESDWVYVTRD